MKSPHQSDQDDFFFNEMSVNFAKYIYQIINIKFNSEQTIPVYKLQENFKKANEYDSRLLTLLYGSVGIMSLTEDTKILEDFFKKPTEYPASKF